MGYFSALETSASGLTAQRLRMDVISQNLANASTTRTATGDPYRRKTVVFQEKSGTESFASYLSDASRRKMGIGNGVRVTGIVADNSPFREVYDPGHPDADENGIVRMPNVDTVTEMVDMISATRAYDANVTAMSGTKAMALKALEIGR